MNLLEGIEMLKKKINLIVIFLVLISLPLVSGEEIIGNSVVEENAFSKISATPHHTLCLPGIECVQYVDITNKTGSAYDDLYLAWVFNYELTKDNGKLELWKPSVFGWVEHSRTCESNYSYELNKYPVQRNPHEASCDYIDNMGNPQTWVQQFHSGDVETKTMYYDAWQVVGGNKWIDVTSYISKASKGNQFAYYTDSPFSMGAGETLNLRLSYIPSLADNSKKYDIYYYRGASASCLINNNCTYVQKLDPWFDTEFEWRRQITITGAGDYNVLRLDLNASSFGAFGNLFDSSVQDGNAILFTNCAQDTQLFHNKRFWVDGSRAIIDINTGAAPTEPCIFIYYGNDTNALDQSRPSDVYDIWDDFEDGDFTGGPAVWTVQSGTWSAASGALQWQSGSNFDDISVNFGSSFDYSEGFFIDANFIVCVNCNIGVMNEASDDDPAADGYRTTETIGAAQDFKIERMTNGGNAVIGTTATTNVAANKSTFLKRNDVGKLRIHKEFQPLPINTATDTTHNTGQYLVLSHFSGGSNDGINSVYFTFHFNDNSTFSVGAELMQPIVDFTVIGSGVVKDLNNLSSVISPPTPTFQWFVNGVLISTDVNTTHNFGSSQDSNVSLVMTFDGEDFQIDKQITTVLPQITIADYNITSTFSPTQPTSFGAITMKCIESFDNDLNYHITLNGTTISTGIGDANRTLHLNNINFLDGTNIAVFTCTNEVSNNTISTSVNIFVFIKKFFMVFDSTGVFLTGKTDYTLADVNSIKVYSNNLQSFIDLFPDGNVNFFYVGDSNDGIEVRIGYTDPSFPFVSRTFDLAVLDTNNTPICFSNLQTFYQQLIISSISREVILKNAHTGCYQLAAITDFAFSDFFSVSGFTIPQSYNLFLVDQNETKLLAIVDGSSAGQINLDLLLLKRDFAEEILIAGEGATIAKTCNEGVVDCNTFTVFYKNQQLNSVSVEITIFNGTVPQITHTETANPNNFSFIFESTNLDFDANILKLVVIYSSRPSWFYRPGYRFDNCLFSFHWRDYSCICKTCIWLVWSSNLHNVSGFLIF